MSGLFPPRWTNLKAIRIGYWSGRGYTSVGIAEMLDDGTTAGTIRPQLQRAGIHRGTGDIVPARLSAWELGKLNRLALARGMAPDEWLSRIFAAAIRDDLFDAIVDEGMP